MTTKVTVALAAIGLMIGMSGSVHAATNFVTNGSFETITGASGGQLGDETEATGWTTTGYNFLFTSVAQAGTGVTGSAGNLQLWTPANTSENPANNHLNSNNGFVASPDGGNFVADDGAYEVQPLSQTVTGLTVGRQYTVTFYWGAAQQSGYYTATTDQWIVSLGSQSFSTPVDSIAAEGFSGWTQQSFTYTATAGSEVLTFLANGTPAGEPPFALLDGVTMFATPEPSSLAVMSIGALALAGIILRRLRTKKPIV